MARLSVGQYKELIDLFNSLTGARLLWDVFNDCIEMFAIAFQNQYTYGYAFEKNEKRYKEIASRYNKKEFENILKIFAKIVNMLDEKPFQDLLGELYMRLDMGSSALGQVFTPYHLSYFMAETMDIELVKTEIEEKGYITINEPACGGGANVIAMCEYLHKNEINYQTKCIIVCQDISRLTALMCYVVLSLIGCGAVVKIADTVKEPYTNYQSECQKGSEIWTPPMFHVNNCYDKI